MRNSLTQSLFDNIDLPLGYSEKCFNSLLKSYGKNPSTISLEDLREILADHLQNVLLEMNNGTEN